MAYYGAYAYVIYETVAGRLSWGSLQFLAGALAGASTNIQSIFATFSSIADQSLFLTDLVEFLRVQPKIASKPDALPAPRPIREGFLFDGVSFAYPGCDRLVLDRLDLRIEPGERIALIGENGQGKTTVVKLLTRLYDLTAGRILLDGIDLREYSVEDLHNQISVIFQDFMRYEMTAGDEHQDKHPLCCRRHNQFHFRSGNPASRIDSGGPSKGIPGTAQASGVVPAFLKCLPHFLAGSRVSIL